MTPSLCKLPTDSWDVTLVRLYGVIRKCLAESDNHSFRFVMVKKEKPLPNPRHLELK